MFIMQESGWSMEAAIEYYYNLDPGRVSTLTPKNRQQPSLSREAIEQLYSRYRDQHAQAIMAEGVGRLCDDLEVNGKGQPYGAHSHTFEHGISLCALCDSLEIHTAAAMHASPSNHHGEALVHACDRWLLPAVPCDSVQSAGCPDLKQAACGFTNK